MVSYDELLLYTFRKGKSDFCCVLDVELQQPEIREVAQDSLPFKYSCQLPRWQYNQKFLK